MAKPLSSVVLAADGTIDANAWLAYWSALWSAPTQPGYAKVVREGITRLIQFASFLDTQARAGNTTGGATMEGLAAQARDAGQKLGGYGLLAFATDDGPTLESTIVTPLLSNVKSPLWDLAIVQSQIVKTAGLPLDWSSVLKRDIFDPMGRAAAKGLPWLLIAAAAAAAVYFATKGGD